MDFTLADRESKTWQKIKAHCEKELEVLRTRNDGKMNENDRNFLIGQIFMVKTMLALEKPVPVMPPLGSVGG